MSDKSQFKVKLPFKEGDVLHGKVIIKLGNPVPRSDGELVLIPVEFEDNFYRIVILKEGYPFYRSGKDKIDEMIEESGEMPQIKPRRNSTYRVQVESEERFKIIEISLGDKVDGRPKIVNHMRYDFF